jgi:[ribosomal protein S18]-alanine N-acetyltransferase
MWLFRKHPDLKHAQVRPLHADDLTVSSRLFRDGARRYYGLNGDDLPGLLEAGRGVGLEIGGELVALALVSMPSEHTCWMRGIGIAAGLDWHAVLERLIPALHDHLSAQGSTTVYYAGDDGVDPWLIPALQRLGYHDDTEVVVYEKPDLLVPDQGNPDVQIRPAGSDDLAEVLRLDQLCFEPHWVKDATILGPALSQGPYIVVADLDGEQVGYAYATSHFAGRLIHLVRIAVDPTQRGSRIGVRLLADLTAFAVDHGASVITLNTQAYNTQAQRLYQWFGFAPTGERQRILRADLKIADKPIADSATPLHVIPNGAQRREESSLICMKTPRYAPKKQPSGTDPIDEPQRPSLSFRVEPEAERGIFTDPR